MWALCGRSSLTPQPKLPKPHAVSTAVSILQMSSKKQAWRGEVTSQVTWLKSSRAGKAGLPPQEARPPDGSPASPTRHRPGPCTWAPCLTPPHWALLPGLSVHPCSCSSLLVPRCPGLHLTHRVLSIPWLSNSILRCNAPPARHTDFSPPFQPFAVQTSPSASRGQQQRVPRISNLTPEGCH